MSAPAPGETFRFPVRVYYEDTDAAGVVYYANYLKFMERARTEWLAAKGFAIAALEREHGIAFAVRHVEIDYLRPARLGDRLDVSFVLLEGRRASLVADQEIRCGGRTLARARITVACLDAASWRPARIPAALLPPPEKPA
jgi:acyl-CoA thioester hydrolase